MKVQKYVVLVGLLFAGYFTTGCATIVSGTTQKLSVTTQPSDATATVDGNMSAKTPAMFTLERKHDHTIQIKKDGFKETTVLIKRTFNGMATGNILIGGIIGGGIDAASGSTNKLVPERVDLILEEGAGSASPRFAAQKDMDYYDKHILKLDKLKSETKTEEVVAKEASTNFDTTPAPVAPIATM
jgi:hypothetical protein